MTEAETILTPWLQPGETIIRAFRPVPKPLFRWYWFLFAFCLILLNIYALNPSTRTYEIVTFVWQNAISIKEILLALFTLFICVFLFILFPIMVFIIAPYLFERNLAQHCYGITNLGILRVFPIPPSTWWNRFQYEKEVFSPRTIPFSHITRVRCSKPKKDASADITLYLSESAKKTPPFLILRNIENPEAIAAAICDLKKQGAAHVSA